MRKVEERFDMGEEAVSVELENDSGYGNRRRKVTAVGIYNFLQGSKVHSTHTHTHVAEPERRML